MCVRCAYKMLNWQALQSIQIIFFLLRRTAMTRERKRDVNVRRITVCWDGGASPQLQLTECAL